MAVFLILTFGLLTQFAYSLDSLRISPQHHSASLAFGEHDNDLLQKNSEITQNVDSVTNSGSLNARDNPSIGNMGGDCTIYPDCISKDDKNYNCLATYVEVGWEACDVS